MSSHSKTKPGNGGPWLWLVWAVVLLLDVSAAFGVLRLSFDDGLVRTFQSESPHFKTYERFTQNFPGNGVEVFLLLESEDFADPNALRAVAEFVLELQLTDGVTAVISPFSLPLPNVEGAATSLVPSPGETRDSLAARLTAARVDQPAMGRFLSEDNGALLIAVDPADTAMNVLLDSISALEAPFLTDAGVTLIPTGFQVFRLTVVDKLLDDFLMLNILGAIAGTVVAAIALGSVTVAALTAMTSGTALLWVIGLMGWIGIQINVITVALPVLILVLSFADTIHLGFETRRQLVPSPVGAARRAVHRVGPACVLASITTALAFGVLALSSSALISEMGVTGALASLLAVTAVLIVHPLLYITLERLGRIELVFARVREGTWWPGLPAFAARMPRRVTAIALLGIVAAAGLYSQAKPNYSLYDNFAGNDPTRAALTRIETDLGPVGAIHLQALIDPDDPARSAASARDIAARHSDGRMVVSLAAQSTDLDPDALPENLRNRVLSQDGARALVSVPFQYQNGAETRRIIADMEASMASDPEAMAMFPEGPTGLEVMTSFVSAEMLRDMNRGFLIAVAASAVLIGLWLRDPLAGLVALIPNALPIALVGAWLTLSGNGLEFSSGIALTIAFGLAIDDTVHVVNRLRLTNGGSVWTAPSETVAAVREVMPALLVTSAVLCLGLLGTQFAALSSISYFGGLSIAVFILAFLADVIVLPACLIFFGALFGKVPAR